MRTLARATSSGFPEAAGPLRRGGAGGEQAARRVALAVQTTSPHRGAVVVAGSRPQRSKAVTGHVQGNLVTEGQHRLNTPKSLCSWKHALGENQRIVM